MNPSLSFVLPVCNAGESLAAQVHTLLDVLPELTANFEIVLVDDGSTDATDERAAELARTFPQVKLARHSLPRGPQQAITTGLETAAGEVVLVQPLGLPVRTGNVRRAWQQRTARSAAARLPQPRNTSPALLERLRTWGDSARESLAARPGSPVVRRFENQSAPLAAPLAAPRTVVDLAADCSYATS